MRQRAGLLQKQRRIGKTGRRAPDRWRHHERHPGYLSERTGTRLDHRDGRAPGQGRRRKLQRLEQRGHRSLGVLRTELHQRGRGRLDGYQQGGGDQRELRDLQAVLGLPGRPQGAERSEVVHQQRPAHELRLGRRQRRLPQAPRRPAAQARCSAAWSTRKTPSRSSSGCRW